MLQIGAGREEVTAFTPGIGMMGWARADYVVESQASPLYARAFVFKQPDSHRKLAYVCAEICFITLAIRQGVLAALAEQHPQLGYDAESVMLTASHTHCGPGGYSHYALYTLSQGGFDAGVTEAIVNGIVRAIVQADRAAMPAEMRLATDAFAPDAPVAFNRALKAYNRNPEVPRALGHDERHLAVDRTMTLLRFDGADGSAIGCLNWFGVHCTNVHGDVHAVSSDNKGFAAREVEEGIGTKRASPFIAAFAQGAAGDVTPNCQTYPGRPALRGTRPDDLDSARVNGGLQAALALSLYEEAGNATPLEAELDLALMHVDMGRIEIPPDLAAGEVGHRTAPSALGTRMLLGTEEGPGVSRALGDLAHAAALAAMTKERLDALWQGTEAHKRVFAKHRAHGNKTLFLELADRRVFGVSDLTQLAVPRGLDPSITLLKDWYAKGALGDKPWSPQILPLQLAILGPLAIAAVPAEPTTMAGRRLAETLLGTLAERGVQQVLTNGYANAYAGYVTTPEEYDLQLYEGASTHFGRWTLAAFQAQFRRLATELLVGRGMRRLETGQSPPVFSAEELQARARARR